MISKIAHGARLVLYLNGKALGIATSFDFSSDTSRKEIRGIDVPYAQELGATTTSVSGSIGLLRLITDMGAQGYNLVAPQTDAMKEKYISLLLVDRAFDTTIFQCDYAQITSERWSIVAKGIVTGNVTFTGVLWNNDFRST
jgi:hypothetical protein